MMRVRHSLAPVVVLAFTCGCAGSSEYAKSPSYAGGPVAESAPALGGLAFSDVGGSAQADSAYDREEAQDHRRGVVDDAPAFAAGGGSSASSPVAKNEAAPPDATTTSAPATTTDAAAIAPSKRMMIYRASYGLLVANVDEAVQQFMAAVVAAGGYLEARNGDQVSVRVPVARFQPLVDSLPKLGTITAQNLAAMDVTKQYTDTTIRMENAEASRRRLLELLKQATKMEDILSIEREVRRLSEEIERMKGELRYLADQVAFSTISVHFQANAPPPIAWPTQQRSRFEWVNAIGLERVLYDF